MKMKLYLINCSNLYLAFAALSDAEANTATYFYYCVSDLPNKLKDYVERSGDSVVIGFSIVKIPLPAESRYLTAAKIERLLR